MKNGTIRRPVLSLSGQRDTFLQKRGSPVKSETYGHRDT
jgi:hypothetical protein